MSLVRRYEGFPFSPFIITSSQIYSIEDANKILIALISKICLNKINN